MYVAITRARENLYIGTARTRLVFGQTQSYPPSRFVREIPDEFIQEVDTAAGTRERKLESAAKARAALERAGRPPELTGMGSAVKVPTVRSFTPSRSWSPGPPTGQPGQAPPPRAPEPKSGLAASELSKGDRVVHERFGPGTIREKEPVAGDAILVIEFDDQGSKRLMAKQARLVRER
jgi:DNA helicase-2/ATP-dependent DNA helicase PcrA